MKTFQQYLTETGRYSEVFGQPEKPQEKKPETPYQRYLRLSNNVPGLGHKPLVPEEKPRNDKEADYNKRWERGA